MTALSQSAKSTRAEELRRQIADRILDGAMPPGTRLDEQELAALFGVSRTPVREALKLLSAVGLVQGRPHKGMVVSTVTPERLNEMFEVMGELEAACARFSALRMTPAQKQALAELHGRAAQAAAAQDSEGYEQLNTEFHSAIYDGAANAFLEETALSMRRRLRPFRRAQFRIEDRLSHSWAEHDAVVRAILKCDGEAAYHTMRNHVSAVSDASADILSRLLVHTARG